MTVELYSVEMYGKRFVYYRLVGEQAPAGYWGPFTDLVHIQLTVEDAIKSVRKGTHNPDSGLANLPGVDHIKIS